MGIPGILKEIGKGERIALTKFAVEHFERTNRPLRVAIDAAIWNFQHAASQGGKNPALRTMFFRLLKILALPIYPVFVYDGPSRPLTKRGKTVTRYGSCIENEMAKQLLSLFKFPSHTAPGEAEAECALLQKNGIVDAVMSQDVDAIMFGSAVTLRDWSKEGTRGNKTPTHVNVLELQKVKERSGLDSDAMVLVALLSGGDYDDGVAGFGPGLACEIAKAGFGTDLLRVIREGDVIGLREWRERLGYELEKNESGYFRRRHFKLTIPECFPKQEILRNYTNPVVSRNEDLPALMNTWEQQWMREIDVPTLRQYTARMFDWNWKSGARKFVRCFAQPTFQDRLCRGLIQQSLYSSDNITGDRKHFMNDGILELRFSAIPAHMVEIDIEAEADGPEGSEDQADVEDVDHEDLQNTGVLHAETSSQSTEPSSPTKRRNMPWSPFAVEKWWIPATLLKIGMGSVIEDWEQEQRDIIADPKKFATRKCPKKPKAPTRIDDEMRPEAMRKFLVLEEPERDAEERSRDRPTLVRESSASKERVTPRTPNTPSKRRHQLNRESQSPSITRFFKPRKTTVPKQSILHSSGAMIEKHLADTTVSINNRPTAQIPPAISSRTPMLDSNPQLEPNSPIWISSAADRPSPAADTWDGVDEDISESMNITTRSRRRVPLQQVRGRKPEFNDAQNVTSSSCSDLPKECSDNNIDKTTHQKQNRASVITRVNVLPRDSLPGTWRELRIGDCSERRPARVSYVDLTGD